MKTNSIVRRPHLTPCLIAVLAGLVVVPARADYATAVQQDKPLASYRFNNATERLNINKNSGSLGAAGNATNLNARLIPGAIAGSRNAAVYFDSTARAIVPWNAALNPDATKDFTIEAWFYPTSDKVDGQFVGPSPINNRYSYSGVNRQGWVYFQRNPDPTYSVAGHQSDVGWNFRTYRGEGSSTGISITSQVPYQLGQWQHVVTVWDGAARTATMYIDGQEAATQTWSEVGQGYEANTDDHGDEAVNGPAGLCFGSYNNTEPGANPFRGAIDEVAFYAKKLTVSQILAHYQNATNTARATDYTALVQADSPVGYWRLNDPVPGPDMAVNMGSVQNAGHAENTPEVRHPAGGSLAGSSDGAYSYHWRNGSSTTSLPWLAENNPDATVPFTVEAWFRPTSDRVSPGACPINNRLSSGVENRTGWVFFQRAPNDTYSGVSGFEGVGWNFRLYAGSGSASGGVTSGLPYNIGEWQHVVATWDGISTAAIYINGVAAASDETVVYTANSNPPMSPDEAVTPADLAVGSYNKASGFGGNPFEGDIDEVAIYANLLSAEQILAHYQAGTNSHRGTNYETLVLTAAYDGEGTQAMQPVTYLRFNESAFLPAANSGLLGDAVGGVSMLGASAAGPQPAGFPGFEAVNTSALFNGSNSWVSLENPPGLNLKGQISLEAWIQPGATQNDRARILSHGPPTLSSYDASQVETNASPLSGSEVFLRVEDGANYAVGCSDGTNFHGVLFPVPVGDLGGGQWIYLVGLYDGAEWKLYRNGVQVAAQADTVGALPVPEGGWAIGASGNGWADTFNGLIDEAAIYDHALTPAQVVAHYNAALGKGEAVTLKFSRASDGKLTFSWSSGTLEYSETMPAASWKPVTGAAAPSWTITPATTGSMFYRLRIP